MIQPEKIAIVTGANRGIGLEISKQLAGSGFHVIMACRDGEKARVAAVVAGGTPMVLDLASEKSIRDFAAEEKRSSAVSMCW
jgi:NAD(P)-dependent dehydrogenase (short-subunit alcohol dehydrogenase family)